MTSVKKILEWFVAFCWSDLWLEYVIRKFFYPLAYAFSAAANRAPKVNLIAKRIERSLNRTCCSSSSLSVLEDKTPSPSPVNAAAVNESRLIGTWRAGENFTSQPPGRQSLREKNRATALSFAERRWFFGEIFHNLTSWNRTSNQIERRSLEGDNLLTV